MKSILLVDDDPMFLKGLMRLLERHADGWTVTTAQGGREAIRLADETAFDLIITDIIMPNQDGFETIREVRKRWPSTKLIAMTGGSDRVGVDFLQVAQKLGANEILAKPFSTEDLITAIGRALSSTGPAGPLAALPAGFVAHPERRRTST